MQFIMYFEKKHVILSRPNKHFPKNYAYKWVRNVSFSEKIFVHTKCTGPSNIDIFKLSC